MHIDCKGFLVRGPHKPAVVVVTKQGLLAQGKDGDGLVPVGLGELQEGGGPALPPGNTGKAQIDRPDPNNTYRTRVIVLLDISSSMAGGKLSAVQNKINDLSAGLQKQGALDVEYIVIPYDENIYPSFKTSSPKDLIKFIQSQTPKGSTDISKALSEGLKTIDINKQSEARNIILLITDGQNTCGDTNNVYSEAAKALPHDASVYCIGVGNDYDLGLLTRVLKEAKFGGLAHITNISSAKNPVNVFGDIIPEFIAQVRTAPDYPIVSFDSTFSSVHNLNPSTREVIQELYERELLEILKSRGIETDSPKHYPSRCGYQLLNFSCGFTENPDKGKVIMYVKPQGNSKQILQTSELDIIPLDEAIGLDPSERQLIENTPKLIEFQKAVSSKDKNIIEDFLKRFDGKLKQEEIELARNLIKNLENPFSYSEDHARDSMSQVGSMHSCDTVTSFGHTVTGDDFFGHPTIDINPLDFSRLLAAQKGEQVNDLSIIPPNESNPPFSFSPTDDPALHSGHAGNLFNTSPVGDLPIINGPQDINPKAYDDTNLQIVFKNISMAQRNLDVSEVKELSIGRHPKNRLVVPLEAISKFHCKIVQIGNQLFLLDNNSRNGTFLNGKRVGANTDLDNIITSGDTIKIGSVEFNVNF